MLFSPCQLQGINQLVHASLLVLILTAASVLSDGSNQAQHRLRKLQQKEEPHGQSEDLEDVLRQQTHGDTESTIRFAKSLADRHFSAHGAKWPSPEFVQAVEAATMETEMPKAAYLHSRNMEAADDSGMHRRVVLMAMANDVAFNHTIPTFLASLANVTVSSAGINSEGTQATTTSLADHLVIACSSSSAASMCRKHGLGPRCVVDVDMALGTQSLPFHSIGFNMIGFAKIKYILNALSLGRDVIFLDTDIVVFQNFVPYVLSLNIDMGAAIEKCRVIDDHHNYGGLHSMAGMPMFNIGVTYFRSIPRVVRCVYNWLFDMWVEVNSRPRIWDQDVFRKVMFHCTRNYGASLHAFSTRRFNSHCYKECGCAYSDQDVVTKLGQPMRTVRLPPGSTSCAPNMMRPWLLMHFPCSGESNRKGAAMSKYLTMYHSQLHAQRVAAALHQEWNGAHGEE